MIMMRSLLAPVSIFIATAFVGPLIRLAAWPPSNLEHGLSASIEDFVYGLVFLLWPTQQLAAMEVHSGFLIAGTVSVIANIALFATIGVISGALLRQRHNLFIPYLLVSVLVLLVALWGAGFSFAYLNIPALLVALLIYALPFWLTAKIMREN